MIGVTLSESYAAVDEIKRTWAVSFDEPVHNLNVHSFRYLVVRVGNSLQFVGRISHVSVFPAFQKRTKARWVANIDRLCDIEELGFDLGSAINSLNLISSANESVLEDVLSKPESIDRPRELPISLSIKEAVAALNNRYDVPVENIKISLHN